MNVNNRYNKGIKKITEESEKATQFKEIKLPQNSVPVTPLQIKSGPVIDDDKLNRQFTDF